MIDCRYKKGDWVSFMREAAIQHGEVLYTQRTELGRFNIYTTNGAVLDKSILESRPVADQGSRHD